MPYSRYRNLTLIVIIDSLLVCSAFYLAHLIRFEFQIDEDVLRILFKIAPYLVIIKLLCFGMFDLYRGMWRYTSLNSLANIIKASLAASFLIIVYVLWKYRFEDISRSVFLIDLFLSVFFIIGFRIFIRLCYENITQDINFSKFFSYWRDRLLTKASLNERVLIIGAGDCAEKIFREIRENFKSNYEVVGFLDDDQAKIGRKIHGIRVLSSINDIKNIVSFFEISEALIALPSVSAVRMREIVNLCIDSGIKYRTVPSLGELINGKISIDKIRKVEYRDLLGRQPVNLDTKKIGRYLGGKVILITGAGGSIGNGLCRQICKFGPEKVILFDKAESPLYDIEIELKKTFPDIQIIPVLGDIQQKIEIEDVFSSFFPAIVFHAAAYKHVPMLEHYPWKAVKNNVLGTENLTEMADRYNCEKFVFISTDKAVNPTNVMGATKRISEMIVQNRNIVNSSKTTFVTVRFGNVIGSAGSVIPLFKKQIKEGGPVTVTHPKIIRYFMLIPEACQLILQAGAMGKGGEIFILEMGEPVNIDNMARDLIKFSGFEPDVDIEIIYTGLRPGEKLYEELMTAQENVVPTNHNKILVLNASHVDTMKLNGKLDELKTVSENRCVDSIKMKLTEIIPEYNPNPLQE